MQRRSANSLNVGLALVAAVIVLMAPSVYADPPSRAARLSYVTGPVSLAPAGLPDEWGEAFVNRPITVGDRLWSDGGGRAEIRLGSTAMRIDGNTLLDVLDLDDRMLQVSLDQGRAHIRTRGGAAGNAEIDTPAAAIVINGAADVRVDVDASSGRTSVLVRAGRAAVYTPSESFDLATGESTRIDAGGRYYTIGRVGPRDAFDQFSYARDTRWREPRYVSAEMTGYEDLDQYGAWQPSGEYGNVWFPRTVSSDWAPYRDGRWMWVEPWGWTWVDNAPWGFAPFHYGRWVQVGPRWGWWPGERVATPVYAPALVAFFGGDGFGVSVAVGAAPAVGWFPLGYRDPYIPWYATSPSYRRNINVAYVRDPVVLNQVVNVNVTNVNVTTVNNFRYAHRERTAAATVVPRNVFVGAQPVRAAAVAVAPTRVASANIVVGAAPVAPERQSLVGQPGRADRAPRADRNAKPIMAVNAPPAAQPRFEQRQAESAREQGKPFEVKPLAPRDDRRPGQDTRNAGVTPQGAPATAAAAAPSRNVQVLKPATRESREARDRGQGGDRNAQAPQAPAAAPSPQPGTPPAQATPREAVPPATARTAPQDDRERGKERNRQEASSDAPGRARVLPPPSMTPEAPQAATPAPERRAAPQAPAPQPQAATPQPDRRAAPQAPAPQPQAVTPQPDRRAAPQAPAPQPQAATPPSDRRADRDDRTREAPPQRVQPAPPQAQPQAQPRPAPQTPPQAQAVPQPPQGQPKPQQQAQPKSTPPQSAQEKEKERNDEAREARNRAERRERQGG